MVPSGAARARCNSYTIVAATYFTGFGSQWVARSEFWGERYYFVFLCSDLHAKTGPLLHRGPSGDLLLWRLPTLPGLKPVSSAVRGLTSLFGMGRGEHPPHSHHQALGELSINMRETKE